MRLFVVALVRALNAKHYTSYFAHADSLLLFVLLRQSDLAILGDGGEAGETSSSYLALSDRVGTSLRNLGKLGASLMPRAGRGWRRRGLDLTWQVTYPLVVKNDSPSSLARRIESRTKWACSEHQALAKA
jgi:hypothetical protein